jgi:hypothetical protein
MDKDRVAGVAHRVKGAVKETVGQGDGRRQDSGRRGGGKGRRESTERCWRRPRRRPGSWQEVTAELLRRRTMPP